MGEAAPAPARRSRRRSRRRRSRRRAASRGARRSAGRPRRRRGSRARTRPSSRASVARAASTGALAGARARGRRAARRSRCRSRSAKTAPSASSSARSARKFSMMPLWTTATPPAWCGWALRSVGWPWVAQRVWPMPAWPRIGSWTSRSESAISLPTARRRREAAVVHRGDAGAVVAAVLEPLQRLEDQRRDLVAAEDARRCRTSGASFPRLERAQPLHQPRARAPGFTVLPRRGASASAPVGHVLGDHRARRDQRAVADRDRRDQRAVRADEGAGADLGAVLEDAVVVAGDGAGADVGAGADPRVADVGEVVDLGAFLDDGVLDLDEVADVRRPRRSRRRGAAGRTGRPRRRG